MDEEKHDPRDKDVSDQLPEEEHEGTAEGAGPRGDDQRSRRDADTEDGDAQQATGNPRAAG